MLRKSQRFGFHRVLHLRAVIVTQPLFVGDDGRGCCIDHEDEPCGFGLGAIPLDSARERTDPNDVVMPKHFEEPGSPDANVESTLCCNDSIPLALRP